MDKIFCLCTEFNNYNILVSTPQQLARGEIRLKNLVGGSFFTRSPISPLEYRLSNPTKAHINIRNLNFKWTLVSIYDDWNNLSIELIIDGHCDYIHELQHYIKENCYE